MAFETGTATSHTDLFTKLKTFLTTASPSGAGWTELDSDATRVIYEAPGLGGGDEIFVGLGLYESVTEDIYSLFGWMFTHYQPTFDFEAQPGHSGTRTHPIWSSPMTYWFYGNGQRVIVITKVNTIFLCSYLGRVNPYATAGEYPFPWFVGMPYDWPPVSYSSVSENLRSFFDPRYGRFLNVNGVWYTVRSHFDSSGFETDSDGDNYIWPYSFWWDSVGNTAESRFRELRENLDGSYSVFPLILGGYLPTSDLVGELDGAFAVPGFAIGAEDTLTIGADTYDIFPNAYRTARFHYVAVKR